MRTLGSIFAETCTSWLDTLSHCCPPLGSHRHTSSAPECEAQADVVRVGGKLRTRILSRADNEKPEGIFCQQPAREPAPTAGPLFEPAWPSGTEHSYEPATRNKRSMSGSSRFSMTRRLLSGSSTSRRPQISGPSNFRHLHSESFRFPSHQPQQGQRQASFRPLELSIYDGHSRLSPLIPDFDINQHVAPPPAVHARGDDNSWDDSSVTLTHERSHSSNSFHLPRRQDQGHESSSFTSSPGSSPPRVPPRARARAYTAPSVDRILERIADAMLEKERLQAEIDSIVERQSIYTSSRPTTAYGMQDLEPMPSIPALPAAAPSFAERLSTDGLSRPQQTTSPAQPIYIPQRGKPFAEAAAQFNDSPRSRHMRDELERPLAPPLPLVLRPPLRKKKSFSRVSSWLFPSGAEQHQREISLDSITNLPRPVTDKDGFYQSVGPQRTSLDTATTVSSQWETEDGDEEKSATVPTTWSPSSSAMTAQETPTRTRPAFVNRMATFGKGSVHRPQSVGVAF